MQDFSDNQCGCSSNDTMSMTSDEVLGCCALDTDSCRSVLSRLIETSTDAIVLLDDSSRIVHANPSTADLLGMPFQNLVGHVFTHPYKLNETTNMFLTRPNNSTICVEINAVELQSECKSLVIITMKDVTIQTLVTQAMNDCLDHVVIADLMGRVLYVNAAFTSQSDQCANLLGRSIGELDSPENAGQVVNALSQVVSSGGLDHLQAPIAGGVTVIGIPQHHPAFFIAVGRGLVDGQSDVVFNRDSLTDLPSRQLTRELLNEAVLASICRGTSLGLILVDIDDFKIVNDSLGHDIGDQVLKLAAERLTSLLRSEDFVGRMSGDEFLIVLRDIDGASDVEAVAKRILSDFSIPFAVDGRDLFVTASLGMSLCPDHGRDVKELLKSADSAMHIAKETGKNTYQLYDEKMSARIDERLMLEHGLRRALDRDEFILYYQPCLDLSGYKVTGYEALIRWNHPEMGLVMPDRFIPLAEERGFIEHIDEWVLEKACRQAVSWQQTGLGRLKASVNISGRQFARTDLVGTVRRVLVETGLSANLLMLELTETTLVHNPEAAVGMLRQLKQMGVQIAIDDFGTGYSSLNYLKQFPIDALKVDRSFVRDITMNPNDAAIVGAIIAMAHSLCLRVIAEGVETQEQLEFLKMLQCDDMQGYLASRPVPAEEFTDVVHKITNSRFRQSIQTSLQY